MIDTRNKMITKFMPLIQKIARKAHNPDDGRYTYEDTLSIAYESAVVLADRHVEGGNPPQQFAAHLTTWLLKEILIRRNRMLSPDDSFDDIADYVGTEFDLSQDPTPEEAMIEAEDEVEKDKTLSDVIGLMDNLKPRHKQVLELCYLENMTQSEAALVMGIKQHSLSELLANATVALRTQCDNNDVKL